MSNKNIQQEPDELQNVEQALSKTEQFIENNRKNLLIGLAVFGIYVRKNLAAFKKDAPRLLVYFRIATSVLSLIYSVGSGMIVPVSASIGSAVSGEVIGLAILLFCEIKYFNNRKHLFVN
jgi:hypothetical protein